MTDQVEIQALASGTSCPRQPFRTLADAQADPDGVVVLERDDGSEIYLACPARDVRCPEETLRELLREIDALEWHVEGGGHLLFEAIPEGATIVGGMGGGRVTGDLWIHARLRDHAGAIRQVLDGARARLK